VKLDHPLFRAERAKGALVMVALLMGALGLAFFRAQVLRASDWRLQSDSNRLRALALPAPRGTLFDRNDNVLADNVPGYAVVLLPAHRDSIRARMERLAPHLDLAPARVERLLEQQRALPRQPFTVKVNASFQEVSLLEERRDGFPGLELQMRPRRRYLAGEALAHVLGSLGEVSPQELESPAFAGYQPGWIVGKDGIERQYEQLLQGAQGYRLVEVDALGRIVGPFEGPTAQTPAEPGVDLQLNIDLDLQQWIHRIFPEGMTGAVVALDVSDGGILALYSAPVFDPNDFVGGISPERWEALNTDPARPLFNRAVQGRYPPGSTWKLATAAMAIDLGVVRPDETMPIPCTGGMQYGNRYWRCWKPEGHGYLDMEGALGHSCNVYFYQLGLRIGLHRMLEEGVKIGLDERCGVDLPVEAQGRFPRDLGFWERTFGLRPTEAEVLSLAIGQGPNEQTPLKIAQFYVAIARDGSAPPPRLLKGDSADSGGWTLDLSREALEVLREGLKGVLLPGGTAHLSSLEHWDLMGKTGTAQNPPHPSHAWFAGIAGPRDGDPEIVVVAIVEFGESGSTVAAPLVAKTADYYLRRKYGIPIDTIQTLGEHYRTGTPAPWASRFWTAGGEP
jgi:penicillin-binding protein 2